MVVRIESDLKAALKAGEKRRVATLRLLLAALRNEKIQSQRDLTEEEIETAIRRAVKQRKEAIELYERGGRADLVAAEKEELEVLEAYLPKALSEEETEREVRRIVEEKGLSGGKDVGPLMKELMARHRGRADGRKAQEIARRLLP